MSFLFAECIILDSLAQRPSEECIGSYYDLGLQADVMQLFEFK